MLITENKALNGIEVTFERKPNAEILTTLKSNGFHWHRQKKVWYAKKTEERFNLLKGIENGETVPCKVITPKPVRKENKYGVKVGDLFNMSFGYNMTIQSFFQVVELVGTSSVKVIEVKPEKLNYTGGGYYGNFQIAKPNGILPSNERSQFIHDREKGDLKRVSIGYADTPTIKIKDYIGYLVTDYNREYYYNTMD